MGIARNLLVMTVSMIVVAGSAHAIGGEITYQLINYPEYQNGLTLSGSITTDGKIGTISTADILSWTFTISSSAEEYTVTSQNGSLIASDLNATASELILPYPTSSIPGADLSLTGFAHQNSNVELEMQWSYPTSPYYECATLSPSFGYLWQTRLPLTGTTSALIAATAAVPEPASIILTAMAGVCGIASGLGRGRKPVAGQAV